MSKPKIKLIKLSITTALTGQGSFRVGAVADSRSGIRVASNIRKTHPKMRDYPYPLYATQHAEFRLVANNLDILENSIVYVARVNRRGLQRFAKPCSACQLVLKSAGVRTVYYTLDNNGVGTLAIS